ncbi:MAG: hypothetical protein K6T91_04525 [Firmicutes bacterium]|nr:hypothetical protein [Bacillota bacterium]
MQRKRRKSIKRKTISDTWNAFSSFVNEGNRLVNKIAIDSEKYSAKTDKFIKGILKDRPKMKARRKIA